LLLRYLKKIFYNSVAELRIVTFGGKVFRTEPLPALEWAYIIAGTSVVLWIGEIWRGVKRMMKK